MQQADPSRARRRIPLDLRLGRPRRLLRLPPWSRFFRTFINLQKISDGLVRWQPDGGGKTLQSGHVTLGLTDIVDLDDEDSTIIVGTKGADYHFNFGFSCRPAADALMQLDAAEMTLRAAMDVASQRKEAEAALHGSIFFQARKPAASCGTFLPDSGALLICDAF